MSLNVPLTHQTLLRLPKIQQGLREGLNYTQIGQSCGVTEKTIDRDMQAWVQSGEFEIWIKTEFAALHSHVVVANPLEAYKEIAKIVSKMVTQKREIKEDITLKEIRIVAPWKNKQSEKSAPQTTTTNHTQDN